MSDRYFNWTGTLYRVRENGSKLDVLHSNGRWKSSILSAFHILDAEIPEISEVEAAMRLLTGDHSEL